MNRQALLDEDDFNRAIAEIKDQDRVVLRVVRGQTVNLLLVKLK
jgi:S1-C subfamily serine protease